MPESAPSCASPASARAERASQRPAPSSTDPGDARLLNESELDATFQLLVERAQYITGATGTALALPRGNDMVCRASAGSCAPQIGACLQVRSGLTGESILRRQLLRCDNAETDPRVNLEACRALGIASIVELPLLRPNGEVRGLFELFADHPYAFEERDLIALERMATLTTTALDLAERHEPIPLPLAGTDGDVLAGTEGNAMPPDEQISAMPATAASRVAKDAVANDRGKNEDTPAIETGPSSQGTPEPAIRGQETNAVSATTRPAGPGISIEGQQIGVAAAARMARAEVPLAPPPEQKASLETPAAAFVPPALRVEKCAGCGFPVSEGRTLCLDCERRREVEREELTRSGATARRRGSEVQVASAEMLPAFLANAKPPKPSWLADHVNLLALAVLILGVVVCVVIFR